jgi:subtilase family serine protease
MRRPICTLLFAAGVAAAVGMSTAAMAAPAQPAQPSAAQVASLRAQLRDGTLGTDHGTAKICSAHRLRCQAEVVTTAKSSTRPLATKPPIGYGATELAKAYGVQSAPSRTGTIVVIGAGAYPTLESDLAIYRSTYGLPACTAASGCFKQINYLGGAPYAPSTDPDDQSGEQDIGVETALDVEMASAACPRCKIVSMQVPLQDGFFGTLQQTHDAILHFATGVSTARKLGASAVSISYGYPTDDYSDKGAVARLMTQPGLPIVSSSGDWGFLDTEGQWPQSLPTVISAGGTSLYPQAGTRGYTEIAWNGAGSGCTPDLPPAAGQPKKVSSLCHGARTASDVSAVADPYTGVAVYDSYAPGTGVPFGFIVVGGTSVSSPFLAGLYARAPGNPTVLGPSTLYAAPATSFNDVTIGTNAGLGYCKTVDVGNAVCDSGPGWDGPTGLGTPRGLEPFSS